MNPRFWSFRMFAAMWGVLLGPLVGTVHAGQAASQQTPIVYVEWSGLIDEEQQVWLQQIPRLPALFGEQETSEALYAAIDLLGAIARANGQFSLAAGGLEGDSDEIKIAAKFNVDFGADANKAAMMLRDLITRIDPTSSFSTVEAGGVTYTQADGDMPLMWAERNGKLLVVNPNAIESEAAPPQAVAQNMTRLGRAAGANPDSPWKLRGYCDVPAVVQLIRRVAQSENDWPAQADAVLQELGIGAIKSLYVCIDEQNGDTSLRSFVETEGEWRGILKLWDQQPLERGDLEVIPRDALWAQVANWDLAESWQEAHRVVGALDPNVAMMMDGALGMASGMLGFSITDQVLPAFGDTWVIYDSPRHGGLILTGAVVVADVRDHAAIEGAFARMLELARPFLMEENIRVVVRELEHKGHSIKYLVVPGFPIPIAPAAAFVNDRVVCGLTPQPVKLAISQLDPELRQDSILDHPDVQRVAAELQGIQRFSYGDTAQVVRALYPLVHLIKTAWASLGAADSEACDPGLLWTLPETLDETNSFVVVCRANQRGILTKTFGTTWLVAPGNTDVMAIAMMVSILLPSLSRARELAKRAVSGANLSVIGQVIHIYANEHDDEFPPSLDVLIEESMITEKQLISPRLDDDEESYVYIAGQNEDSDPRNVLAYERMLDGEGTNVLFVDGHVEWLRPDDFAQRLTDTYARLGRDAEVPTDDNP